MLKRGEQIQPLKFYKKTSDMSSRGRGRAKTRDLITAPQIRPVPGKVKPAGNLPKSQKKVVEKKLKAKAKGKAIKKPEPQHDQFSSGEEDEQEEEESENGSNDERARESTSEEESPVHEIDFPPEYDALDNDADEEEENEYSWKCKLLEFIQQYPEVYDKASPRYKKKNLREAAWDDIATAMESDVDTVMAAWRNLRDPYRKKILHPGGGGAGRGGGGGGKKKSGSKGSSVAQQQETWKFYEKMSFYKPYIYTNETKSNVNKRKQNDEEESAAVVPSTSRELAETPKPEIKTTKKYKQSTKLEEKMIEYLDKSPSDQPSKKEEDMISYQMAAIEHMIRESVPKSKHINILFSLVHQVQKYIDNLENDNPAHVAVNPAMPAAIGNYATLTPVPVEQLREIPFEQM